MHAIAVLQARIDSSRLPGKSLLKIQQYPLVLLAALRASNTGLPVIVATSDRQVDDGIADVVQDFGLAVSRGSANDVRARYLAALDGEPDDRIVVRITADNVIPDGKLLELLIQAFAAQSLPILDLSRGTGLPYGVQAEAFRLGSLRMQSKRHRDQISKEHVTAGLWREMSEYSVCLPARWPFDVSHLRASIDTWEDYQRMVETFRDVEDPVGISSRDLIATLIGLDERDLA